MIVQRTIQEELLKKLAKENETIKLIYPKTNGGVSKARNLGLQNASMIM